MFIANSKKREYKLRAHSFAMLWIQEGSQVKNCDKKSYLTGQKSGPSGPGLGICLKRSCPSGTRAGKIKSNFSLGHPLFFFRLLLYVFSDYGVGNRIIA